jgi:hypothetical protein
MLFLVKHTSVSRSVFMFVCFLIEGKSSSVRPLGGSVVVSGDPVGCLRVFCNTQCSPPAIRPDVIMI